MNINAYLAKLIVYILNFGLHLMNVE
jgi:hypothetical protein